MEDTPLPTRAQLQKLLGMLLFADDQDEVAAAIIRERAGIDHERFLQRLRARLVDEAADLRAQGNEVPEAMTEAIDDLEALAEDEATASAGPEEIIDGLLRGEVLGSDRPVSEVGPVQAFRPNEKDYLTENDLRILDQISKELQAQAEDEDEE